MKIILHTYQAFSGKISIDFIRSCLTLTSMTHVIYYILKLYCEHKTGNENTVLLSKALVCPGDTGVFMNICNMVPIFPGVKIMDIADASTQHKLD